jgi:hypothetical protein
MLQWSTLTPVSLRCVAAISCACCCGTLAHLGVLTVVDCRLGLLAMLQWSALTPASLCCVAAISCAGCSGTLAHLGVLTAVTASWVRLRCCSGVP